MRTKASERQTETILNVSEIVKRAKILLNIKLDSELAKYLGVAKGTLSNWCARNSIDFPLLLNKLKGADYNWLLTGKGYPDHEAKVYDNGQIRGTVETIHNSKTIEAMDDRSVTLYDITAAANLKTLLADRRQYALGTILIPNIPVCDGAIFVNGDSMYPLLKSGDIVGFKQLTNFGNVIYGEMYIVAFNLDGDQYLTVKYVNRSEQEGCIKLVSYNPHHEPMDLPMEAIQEMAIVKFSIRKNMMM